MDGRQSVTLVMDDLDLRRFVAVNLEVEGFDVTVASDVDEGLSKINTFRPDLVLVDLGKTNLGALELTRQLRANLRTAVTPVIALANGTQTIDKVILLAAGVDDYIVKPFDTMKLLVRIKIKLRRNRESRDESPMTGLPGNSRILREIASRSQGEEAWAVCLIDIDRFKSVTDTMGFDRAGRFIIALKDALQDAAAFVGAPAPFVGHIGGDDFVAICLPEQVRPFTHTAVTAFTSTAKSLHDPLDADRGYVEFVRNGNIHRTTLVTLSVGVALSSTRQYKDVADIVSNAWEMLGIAKNQPGSYVAIGRRNSESSHLET